MENGVYPTVTQQLEFVVNVGNGFTDSKRPEFFKVQFTARSFRLKVFPNKEDEVPPLEGWSLNLCLIIVPYLPFPYFNKVLFKILVDLPHSFSCIQCFKCFRSLKWFPFRFRFSPQVGVERGDSYRVAQSTIISELYDWQFLYLIVLFIVNIGSKECFTCLVYSFGLVIRLRVIGCKELTLNSQSYCQALVEF